MKELSIQDELYIKLLYTDRTVWACFNDKDKNETYSSCYTNDNGDVVLGKTSCKWWNSLLNCKKTIPFFEYAVTVTKAFAGQDNNRNETILKGLLDVITNEGVINGNKSKVIHQLVTVMQFGVHGTFGSIAEETPSTKKSHFVNVNDCVFEKRNGKVYFRLSPFESVPVTETTIYQVGN
jgi:hypothetical protein